MTIRSFDLLQPRSLVEAVELLQKHGDDARAIGGGTTLVILMKQRALHYPYLVDLQTIPGLNEIKQEDHGVRIGALTTHRMVELSPLIRQTFPVIAEAFSHIGNVRVRQTASIRANSASSCAISSSSCAASGARRCATAGMSPTLRVLLITA